MLKECYSFVKIWLKLQKGKVRLAAFPRYSIALFAVTLPLLLLLSSPDSFARSDCQQFGAQGSANYELEVAASGEGRSRLGASAFALSDSYPVASEVWQVLLQDAVIARLKLPFQWRFALVDDGSMNAFSFPDGEVVVDRKLASLLGKNRGLWAALLSHEIAHVARCHWLQRYSYESRLQGRQPNFGIVPNVMDSRWRMAAFDRQMDFPISQSTLSRELEFEADNEGMMLMARTGFHPAFELAIHQLMEANVSDASSSTASSSTHPSWRARDRNSKKAYSKAVDEFSRRWPATDPSPGGAPPTVVFLGEPKSGGQGPPKVIFSLRCVNPGQPLRSVLTLYEKTEKNGAPREAIEFWEPATCSTHDEKKTLTVTLPADRHADPDWKGQIRILNSAGVALGRSGFFAIHTEKSATRESSFNPLAYQDFSTRH
jgi:Zn-dependent protease with chaperone function